MSKTIVKENYCAKCLKCSSILYTYIKFLKTNAEKEPFLKYITLYYEKRKELSTLQQIQQTYYTCGEDGENEKDLLSIQDQSILYRDGTLPQAEEQIIQERVKSRIHEAWDEFNAIGERKRRKAIENQSLSAAAATTTTTTTTTTQPVFLLKWYPEFHNGNSSRKSSNDKKRKRDRERKEKKKKKEKKKSISATKIDKKQQKEEREGEDLYRLLSPVEIEKEYIADGDDGFYKVENILDKKIEDGRIKYLIKWEGYNIMSASWQDIDDCFCPGLIAEFEIKYHERFSQ
ncbi:hypothetical protein CYY_007893 [Polysphondylium violaceum]|uniref:Chromo domain-containing protein n=1 Tax=Polysphondylium violaceum TaxID=133409 RepID=A0A8J4V1U6_9MYCE|nr:hypothetical protein CYY_007893 [Polysphondylium violaceum]